MAGYVVDASVILEYLVTGPYTQHAQAFFNQVISEDHLLTPEFGLLECTNVIWKQVRFNGMPNQRATELVGVLNALKLSHVSVKPLLKDILTFALNNTLAVYDSSYIALALLYRYPLLSIDQRQMRAAIAEGAAVILITDFN